MSTENSSSPADLDPNKIVAELISRSVKEFGGITTERPVNAIRRMWHTVANAYAPYLEQTYQKVSTIKTFLKTSEPVHILDAYVPSSLKLGTKITDDNSVIEKLHQGEKILISALAGRGKSMTLRFIATALYMNGSGKIPLFLELRALNNISNKDILAYLHSTYSGTSKLRYSDFESALKQNNFILILDGFDEVNHDSRSDIEAKILEICHLYPKTPIVVSSRPDNSRFSSWEKFSIFTIEPMNLHQVRQMVQKCDYDPGVKKGF